MIYQYDIRGKKNLPDFDQSLIWSSIFLLSLGLVMVYSASISIAEAGRARMAIQPISLHGMALIWQWAC